MRARSMTLTCITALLLNIGSPPALGQNWRRVDYQADGFSVEFSGEVAIAPTQASAETRERLERSTDYLQDNGSSAYIVGATLARYSVEFTNGAEASYGSFKCKITLGDVPVAFARGQAREITGTECTDDGSLQVLARYYAVGKWFYQVLAIFPKDGDDTDARRFVSSFALLEPTAFEQRQ